MMPQIWGMKQHAGVLRTVKEMMPIILFHGPVSSAQDSLWKAKMPDVPFISTDGIGIPLKTPETEEF